MTSQRSGAGPPGAVASAPDADRCAGRMLKFASVILTYLCFNLTNATVRTKYNDLLRSFRSDLRTIPDIGEPIQPGRGPGIPDGFAAGPDRRKTAGAVIHGAALAKQETGP